jgi:hypothetical protein
VACFYAAESAVIVSGVLLDVPAYIRSEFVSFLLFFAVYVGTRTFRGHGEEIAPSRPWWRMSALPTASFVLAVLFAIRSVFSIWAVATDLGYGSVDLNFILSCAVDPLLFAGYLNSGIRLARVRTPEAVVAETAQADPTGVGSA